MKPVKFFAIGLEEPTEFIVSWNLGNFCNWQCSYCPTYLNNGSVAWTDNTVIKKVLTSLKNKLTQQKIRVEFMGGEVTVKPDLLELLQFCKEIDVATYIVTNGSRSLNYWEEVSPYLDVAMITFHPEFSKESHLENVVDVMLKHDTRPIINLAMLKDKFWDLVEYKNFLTKKYENRLHVEYTILIDKMKRFNYNGYFCDYDEDQLNHLRYTGNKHYTVEYDNGVRQELSLGEVRELQLNKFTGFKCGTKLATLNIDFNGGASISACPQRLPLDINTDDITSLLEPRICEQDECRNPSDLRIYKIK